MPGGGTGITLFSKLIRTKDLRSVQGADPRSTKPKLTVSRACENGGRQNPKQIKPGHLATTKPTANPSDTCVPQDDRILTLLSICFCIGTCVRACHRRSQKCLTTLDLTSLGVGSCCGTGMYLVAGMVAKSIAGPGVVLSFFIAAVASIFSGKRRCHAKWPP